MSVEVQDLGIAAVIDATPFQANDRARLAAVAGIAASLGRALRSLAIALSVPAALVALWTLSARSGWLPSQILPDPWFVAGTFREFVATGDLAFHTTISLQRLLLGFTIGASLGLLLGIGSGLSQSFQDYVDPLFLTLAQVPSLGWIPFVMLFVGIDETLKVIIIAKAAFVPVALNTGKGIRNVPESYLEVGRVLTFGPVLRLTKIILPAAVPPIFTGIRYGLTHAWMALVAVELIASSEGLGYLTVWGRQLFQLDILIVAMIVIGAIGFILDRSLSLIERRLDRWKIGVA
jgi:sulfonate transport system permease protein